MQTSDARKSGQLSARLKALYPAVPHGGRKRDPWVNAAASDRYGYKLVLWFVWALICFGANFLTILFAAVGDFIGGDEGRGVALNLAILFMAFCLGGMTSTLAYFSIAQLAGFVRGSKLDRSLSRIALPDRRVILTAQICFVLLAAVLVY
jgi:hypothetical protein